VTTDIHEAAPPQAPPPPTARRHRLPRRPVAFLLALAFFFVPLGAFLVGSRAQAIENRPLAEFPSLSEGWSFFPQFTAWATDHLPLRSDAVRGNAALSEAVFGEAPSYRTDTGGGPAAGVPSGDSTPTDTAQAPQYPQVLAGQDGWLYYGQDVQLLCQATRPVQEVLDRLNRLARAVETSGRRFVLTVPPDKSTIYPLALPETYLGKQCSTDRRQEFWDALEQTPPEAYLDLKGPLEQAQNASAEPIYRPKDTHWAPRGAEVYVRALAERLDPALLQDTQFTDNGTVSEPGDLATMLGQPGDDQVQDVQLHRAGVTPVGRDTLDLPEMPYTPETFTNASTGAPLFQPSTLLLGDSFSSASRTMLGQLFSNVTVLHNEVASQFPQAVADLMASSDIVVYEIVERTISSGGGALIDDASLSAIEATLAAQPR
jgi:hypothetical protein